MSPVEVVMGLTVTVLDDGGEQTLSRTERLYSSTTSSITVCHLTAEGEELTTEFTGHPTVVDIAAEDGCSVVIENSDGERIALDGVRECRKKALVPMGAKSTPGDALSYRIGQLDGSVETFDSHRVVHAFAGPRVPEVHRPS